MTPEQILALAPRVLTQSQREAYFKDGFIILEKIIGDEWVRKLRDATDELDERSRKVTKSDTIYDLEPDHTPGSPRLRRVSNPVEHHPVFWDYCTKSPMPDIVADLVGPDVKFHHSKLNFKWSQGGEEVKWHYDISFWPHTNYSPLTIGTYIPFCAPLVDTKTIPITITVFLGHTISQGIMRFRIVSTMSSSIWIRKFFRNWNEFI